MNRLKNITLQRKHLNLQQKAESTKHTSKVSHVSRDMIDNRFMYNTICK